MKTIRRWTGVFLAALSLSSAAAAAPITVHNTGVDGSDALVASGAQASFWALSTKPLNATEVLGSNPFRFFTGPYFPDTSTAAWVSPEASGNASASGLYTYELAIDLTGLDPATAFISGNFGTDNSGAISLNGNPPVATTGGGDFGSPTAFSMSSGFVPGLNAIRVQVANEGNPTAFFVSFTSAAANPSTAIGVPAISWPALAGLALLLAALGSLLARKRPTL